MLALFEAAGELPPADRVAWLESSGAPAHVLEEVFGLLDEEPEPDQPKQGQIYGRYTLTAPLGRGAMGEVFSALDYELSRPVALKFLRSGVLVEESVELLVREARAASALNHPNIITVYDVLRTDTVVAIVTELVDGQPLRTFCGTPQPLARIASWGAQAARGLAAAHARNIIHGDVKPENIMVREDGQVKLLDFGLARRIGPGEADAAITLGSPGYMSPEQMHGVSLTAATDVFSLGLVLRELAAGRHAVEDSAWRRQVPNRRLAALLEAMLRNEPQRRPGAADVADRLTALGLPGKRSALVFSVAGVAISALIAAGIWTGTRPPRAPDVTPVTNYAGVEAEPTLSPDGKQVAFTWSGLDDRRNIYVRTIAGEDLRRLTDSPLEDWSPAWSPDGKWIAWIRRNPDGGDEEIVMSPAVGGPERTVGHVVDHQGFRGLAWWPDSGSLIVRAAFREGRPLVRLFLDGSKTPLTIAQENQDSRPVVSPDSRTLAFTRLQPGRLSICTMPLTGGAPVCRRLDTSMSSIAWLGDSRNILVSGRDGITLFDEKGTLKPILAGAVSDVVADPHTGSVLFAQTTQDLNIWRLDVASGRQFKFIASNREDSEPEYSPGGDRIVFRSDRSGSQQLYICDSNGGKLRQVANLRARDLGSARWSPDGKWIAFDGMIGEGDPPRYNGNANVYIVSAAGGEPRRLTDDAEDSIVPGWSGDSHWVYFTREHGNRRETWKVSVDGGKPLVASSSESFDMSESDGGKWLYYTRPREKQSGIWRRPAAGGDGEEVPGTQGLVYRSWSLRGSHLFFQQAGPPAGFADLDLRTLLVRPAGAGPKNLFNGPRNITVSPDGRTLLYTQLDLVTGDLYRFDVPGFTVPTSNRR